METENTPWITSRPSQFLVHSCHVDKSLPTPPETLSHTALSQSLHTFRVIDTVSKPPMFPDVVTKCQTITDRLLTSLPQAHPPHVSLGMGKQSFYQTRMHTHMHRHTCTHTSAWGSSPDCCFVMQKGGTLFKKVPQPPRQLIVDFAASGK